MKIMSPPIGRSPIELSGPCDNIAGVTDEFAQDVHDLLEAIRGVSTALTQGGPGAFALNFELGVSAFSRGPDHAVGMAAMMSARRFEQINSARVASGSEAMDFPKEDLLSRFPIRKGVVPDCLNLVDHLMGHGLTDPKPVRELVQEYGLPGFMMLVQIYNELGRMLADADPELESLSALMTREAIADELDWFRGKF